MANDPVERPGTTAMRAAEHAIHCEDGAPTINHVRSNALLACKCASFITLIFLRVPLPTKTILSVSQTLHKAFVICAELGEKLFMIRLGQPALSFELRQPLDIFLGQIAKRIVRR